MSLDGAALLAYVAAALLLAGHAALRAAGLRPRDSALAWLGWCAAVGTALNGLLLFAWGWALPGTLSLAWLLPAQALLVAGPWLVALRRPPAPPATHPLPPPAPAWERAVFAASVALAVLAWAVAVGESIAVPQLGGDEAFVWGLKARAVFASGGIGPEHAALYGELGYLRHPDYPPLVSLLQAWVREARGAETLFATRWPFQILSLGLLLATAGAVARAARPWIAAALLAIFAAAPETGILLGLAQSDALVALGVIVAVDGWLRFRASGRGGFLALACLGLALMLLAKNEARLWTLALVVAAPFVPRDEDAVRPPRAARAWLALPALAWSGSSAWAARFGFENNLTSAEEAGSGLLARLAEQWSSYTGPTLAFFRDELFLMPQRDGLLLLTLVLAFVLFPRRAARAPERGAAVAIALGLAGLVLVYVTTPQDLQWHLECSAPRVAWQLYPAAAVALGGALTAVLRGTRPDAS